MKGVLAATENCVDEAPGLPGQLTQQRFLTTETKHVLETRAGFSTYPSKGAVIGIRCVRS